MAWLALPVVLGLGGLFLSGCGSSSSNDAAPPSDSPAGSGSSSFVPGSASALTMPPPRPNPIFTPRTAPLDIGSPPTGTSGAEAVQTWVNQRAVQSYIDEFNAIARTTVNGATVENLYGDNYRAAIMSVLNMIQAQTRDNPLRVTYTVGGTAVTPTIDSPGALFLDRLIALRPETRTAVEAVRRDLSPPPGGTNPVAPRPVPSGDRPPRPSGTGSPHPGRPAGRPNGLSGTPI